MPIEKFSINNTKIANCIRKESGLSGFRNIVTISSRKQKNKVQSKFVISNDLSYFEMSVADAIYSLLLKGDKKFTPRKVLIMMTGDENISMPQERKKSIINIIEKLCNTKIDIFCPQEVNDTILSRYSGNFLSLTNNGNGYKFLGETPMPLYAYGEAKRQMITIPQFLLNVPKLANNNENILLKHYLIHELELVRNQNNNVAEKTFRILDYKNPQLLSALEVDLSNFSSIGAQNKKIKEIYKKTLTILEYWSSKELTGYLVNDFSPNDDEFSIYISPNMICKEPMLLKLQK